MHRNELHGLIALEMPWGVVHATFRIPHTELSERNMDRMTTEQVVQRILHPAYRAMLHLANTKTATHDSLQTLLTDLIATSQAE